MNYFVYFLTNKTNSILYVGMTSNLEKRLYEHREGIFEGFTKKYNCKKLVYFEIYDDAENAILREKQIKRWSRKKKDYLVHLENSDWRDIAEGWYALDPSAHPDGFGRDDKGAGL